MLWRQAKRHKADAEAEGRERVQRPPDSPAEKAAKWREDAADDAARYREERDQRFQKRRAQLEQRGTPSEQAVVKAFADHQLMTRREYFDGLGLPREKAAELSRLDEEELERRRVRLEGLGAPPAEAAEQAAFEVLEDIRREERDSARRAAADLSAERLALEQRGCAESTCGRAPHGAGGAHRSPP